METKRALISGINGMDGSYIAELLISKGYEIYGVIRRSSQRNFKNIQHLIDNDSINLIGGDLADQASIFNAINISRPEELYNLGAQSFVGESWNQAEYTCDVTGLGALRIFDTARRFNKDIKIYQASSSEMYGLANGISPQNENTPMIPRSPYAAAKLLAHNLARIYRESYDMNIWCGICFNHSGPRRGIEFVTRKVSDGVARIKLGLNDELILGNLDSKRDWSDARDMVRGMHLMLQTDDPDDYVLASGESHSIKELIEIAFNRANLDWEDYVIIDKNLYRPAELHELKGDYSKAKKELGWEPKITFKEMVEEMVDNDLKNLMN